MKIIRNKRLTPKDNISDSINTVKEFDSCLFERHDSSNDLIEINSTQIVFKGCSFAVGVIINASVCKFIDCDFSRIDATALTVKDSSQCSIEKCSFSQNGSREILGSQLFIKDSKASILNSTIEHGVNSFGIEATNSQVDILSTIISNNEGCGISFEFCTLKIDKSKIMQNGTKEGDFTQVLLKTSKGNIENTEISNGINSNGLLITDESSIELLNSSMHDSIKNGIAVERSSKLDMDKCKVFKNGDEYEETLQIWIDNSKLTARNSSISDGVCGIYAQKNSYIELTSCEIFNNIGGLCIFESSYLTMIGCSILKNFSKAQIWIEGSKAQIQDCIIDESNEYESIHAEDMMLIYIKNTKLNKEKLFIKNSRNASIDRN